MKRLGDILDALLDLIDLWPFYLLIYFIYLSATHQ